MTLCWDKNLIIFSQSQVRNFWRSFFEARSIEDVTPTLTVPFLSAFWGRFIGTGSEGDVCVVWNRWWPNSLKFELTFIKFTGWTTKFWAEIMYRQEFDKQPCAFSQREHGYAKRCTLHLLSMFSISKLLWFRILDPNFIKLLCFSTPELIKSRPHFCPSWQRIAQPCCEVEWDNNQEKNHELVRWSNRLAGPGRPPVWRTYSHLGFALDV